MQNSKKPTDRRGGNVRSKPFQVQRTVTEILVTHLTAVTFHEASTFLEEYFYFSFKAFSI